MLKLRAIWLDPTTEDAEQLHDDIEAENYTKAEEKARELRDGQNLHLIGIYPN